jgi:hypothetical protein
VIKRIGGRRIGGGKDLRISKNPSQPVSNICLAPALSQRLISPENVPTEATANRSHS